MRRFLVVTLAVLVVVAVVARRRGTREDNKAALVLAITTDVAGLDGPGISWNTYGQGSSTTVWQEQPVTLVGNTINIHVWSEAWSLDLSPSKVFHLRCYTFGDYDHPWGWISFEPEGGDSFDALFQIGFTSNRIATFEDVCTKYDIPIER
jgi:hypothetical protein